MTAKSTRKTVRHAAKRKNPRICAGPAGKTEWGTKENICMFMPVWALAEHGFPERNEIKMKRGMLAALLALLLLAAELQRSPMCLLAEKE